MDFRGWSLHVWETGEGLLEWSRGEVPGALFYLGKSYGYFKTLIKYLPLVGSFPDRLRQNYLPLPLCSYNLCTRLHFSTNVVFFVWGSVSPSRQ